MIDSDYNPVIGYTLHDKNYHVICPHGESLDPVFHSKERALEAAEEYSRSKDVPKAGELYLDGTFGVVMFDEGDLQETRFAPESTVCEDNRPVRFRDALQLPETLGGYRPQS